MNDDLLLSIFFIAQGLLFLWALAATFVLLWRLGHLALVAAKQPKLQLSDLRTTAVWYLKLPFLLAASAWLFITLLATT